MGQQSSLAIPTLKSNNPINFNHEIHEFESQFVQRVKQTPFVGSALYNSQPSVYIETAQMTMQNLLSPRMNTTKLFPKQEILKIIENVLLGLLELKSKNFQNYGNLSLTNIFYHKHTKTFKILNPAFFDSTNYRMVRQGLKFSFLAPEQLLNLTSQEQHQVKSFKTDIFILSICMLQVCSLRDSRQIYCPQTYNIFDVEIRERLKNIQQLYSSDLANFLELCLQYQIEKRIDLENAIKQIRFLKEKEKGEIYKPNSQVNPVKPMLSPRVDSKKGTLSFGPGHLPKKLQPTI